MQLYYKIPAKAGFLLWWVMRDSVRRGGLFRKVLDK